MVIQKTLTSLELKELWKRIFILIYIAHSYDYALHYSELSGPSKIINILYSLFSALFYPIIRKVMNECEEWKNENS